MPIQRSLPGPSILDGTHAQIDAAFGLAGVGTEPRYGLQGSNKLEVQLRGEQAASLFQEILTTIRSNWRKAPDRRQSQQNWRFKKCFTDDDRQGGEVGYEREIVGISENVWPEVVDWANQVPVASGFMTPRSDKRRCIDLVHKSGDKEYEFIELKTTSNTPLFAAMEVVLYGILYFFYRTSLEAAEHHERLKQKDLLSARVIHLQVAAPQKFYEHWSPERLKRLEELLTGGLTALVQDYDFRMDFRFRDLEEMAFFRFAPYPSNAVSKVGG